MKKRIFIAFLTTILVIATVIPIAIPTVANESPELVARWRFDGNTLDCSGNGNHGTVTVASYVASDRGQALDFNGSSDYVIVSDDDTLDITGAITIEAWIKPAVVSSYRTIVSKRYGSIANYSLRLSGGKVEFYYQSQGDTHWSEWCTTDTPVTAGNRYHIAVSYVFGEDDIAVYVNDMPYTGSWLHGEPEDVTGNSYDLYLGYNYPGYPQAFAGTIDEVQIWNGALTGDQLLNPPVPEVIWTVDDDLVQCPSSDFTHPQDAVNAASPGDNILVHPGTYGTRGPYITKPPHWTYPNDQLAPALIIYKDNLTITAVNTDPVLTVIQSTHNAWSNPVAVQASTGGIWDGSKYVNAGVNPGFGTAPNTCAIIASGVTIEGFTFRCPEKSWNTAGIMIGGLYAGYGGASETLGNNNNTVQNCVFSDVWHGIYIWHSSGNQILNNTIEALGDTGHWAGISVYDGYNDDQISLGNLSENNLIANNTIADKGIALGAWAPSIYTSLASSKVCCNTTTQVGVTYAHGSVMIGCNSGGFWHQSTDKVIRISGITYTGDTMLPMTADLTTVNLAAQLTYDGSSDGSDIDIVFRVDGTDYCATTVAGGTTSTSVDLPVGVYTVDANVPICDNCCKYKDSMLLVIYDPTGGFATGGGWIDSPVNTDRQYMQVGGKATFGFVSKYKKGAEVPEGNTEFQFKAGDMNFKSTSYDWLVVTGSDYARYKGIGTINGTGEYKFMVWAGDGEPDTFRIKIWTENESGEETVVYDNGMDQPIGGGSIVVHTSK